MEAGQLRLVARLLSTRSIEELVAVAERTPEVLRPEFDAVVADVAQRAAANGEPAMAVALEQVMQVLRAMRGLPVPEADTPLFELLIGTPLAELTDAGDWDSWQALLHSRPDLFDADLIDHLTRIRGHVREQDLWTLDALTAFLADCREGGTDTAVAHWRSSARVGDGTQLPIEYQIVAMSHLAHRVGPRDDLYGAQALGLLGQLLSRRQLGDWRENLERSERLLRTAADRASSHGDLRLRAQFQQALVNVLLHLDQEANAAEALDLCQAALEGWEPSDDPELWGLLMTSRANCLITLGRSDEAIEGYEASLTVFTREESPKRWAIATFGLSGAHVHRGLHGGDRNDFERGLTLLKKAADLRTREADEARWAMTEDGLGWCYLYRLSPTERADDVRRAIEHFRAALEFYVPGHPRRPHTQNGLGQAYFARYEQTGDGTDLLASRAALTEALEVADVDELRAVHGRLAVIAFRLAATDPTAGETARRHQLEALALVSAEDDPNGWADEVMYLAQFLMEYGPSAGEGCEQAIRRLQEALTIASGTTKARVLLMLGAAYSNRSFGDNDDNYAQAMQCYHAGLAEITMENEPELWSNLRYHMAVSIVAHEPAHSFDEEAREARYAEALSHLNEALVSGPPSPGDAAVIRSVIGEVHLRYEHRREAIAPLEQARDELRKLGHAKEFASVQLRLAHAYGAADPRSIRAAATARRLTPLPTSPRDFGAASQWLGLAHLERGEYERAGHAFHDAVQARTEALRPAWLPTDRATIRRWFRSNIAERACLAFARAAERTSEHKERARLLALAVESLDAGRMRGFAEFDAGHLAQLARHDPALHRELEEAVARVQAAARIDRASLTGALVGPRAVIPDAERWLADREEARASRARYLEVLARIRTRTGLDLVDEPLLLSEIAGLLGPEDALAYVLSDDGDFGTQRKLILLVLPDATVRMHWSQGAVDAFFFVATWLPNQSIAHRTRPAQGDSFTDLLRRALDAALPLAAEQLSGPLGKELRDARSSRVFLVTCGILGHFPLHACAVDAEGQVALGEEFDVSYLPSAAVLRALRARSAQARSPRVVTVANPLPNPQPLPFAATQQAEIAAV
ncbi:CHAT domain-containing protein, partial [Streptomyces sp. T21Q-yed]